MQTNPTEYSGVLSSCYSILRNEGIPAFWKGAVPTAMGMAAENAMAFGVNEALKRAFPDDNPALDRDAGPPSLWKPFAMGAITGCCSATVLLPSEVIKAKLQVIVGKTSSATEVMAKMIARQGRIRAFMIGFDAQLARDASFYATFFGGYEMFCYLFGKYVPDMPDQLKYFMSGGLAGMFGWTLAMPFDVPKTNVQSRYDTKVFGSYLPELVRIARQRGIVGLYSGLGPTLVRAFPANAALFLGVETGKKFFDNYVWKQSAF